MIRPLRRAHRIVVLTLALLLPLLVAVAVRQRVPTPRQMPWPLAAP